MVSKKFPKQFITIPAWIVLNLKFESPTQLITFSLIYGFPNHQFRGGYGYIAKFSCSTTRTICRVVKELVKKGYIKKEYVKGYNGKYCILTSLILENNFNNINYIDEYE